MASASHPQPAIVEDTFGAAMNNLRRRVTSFSVAPQRPNSNPQSSAQSGTIRSKAWTAGSPAAAAADIHAIQNCQDSVRLNIIRTRCQTSDNPADFIAAERLSPLEKLRVLLLANGPSKPKDGIKKVSQPIPLIQMFSLHTPQAYRGEDCNRMTARLKLSDEMWHTSRLVEYFNFPPELTSAFSLTAKAVSNSPILRYFLAMAPTASPNSQRPEAMVAYWILATDPIWMRWLIRVLAQRSPRAERLKAEMSVFLEIAGAGSFSSSFSAAMDEISHVRRLITIAIDEEFRTRIAKYRTGRGMKAFPFPSARSQRTTSKTKEKRLLRVALDNVMAQKSLEATSQVIGNGRTWDDWPTMFDLEADDTPKLEEAGAVDWANMIDPFLMSPVADH